MFILLFAGQCDIMQVSAHIQCGYLILVNVLYLN